MKDLYKDFEIKSKKDMMQVVYSQTIDEYKFYICVTPFNPVCYVRVPESHPYYGKKYDEISIEVHGGLTFSGDRLFIGDGYFIGWDYGHFPHDYITCLEELICESSTGHKYTQDEILEDAYMVINQLKTVGKQT